MNNSVSDQNIVEKIQMLAKKFDATGQDLSSYLEGLMYSDYLKYWDYIQLDTLLTLQKPKTDFPDEIIFITYHQITELYFKLILWEIHQLTAKRALNEEFFLQRLQRINRYFDQLIHSFSIMVDGMEQDQFLKFRMALLPSSGFQSVQYRLIEISSTDLVHLADENLRPAIAVEEKLEDIFEKIYWKKGATELATGRKTLSLVQFEEKYTTLMVDFAREYESINLRQLFLRLEMPHKAAEIKEAMRSFDLKANVFWPLTHFKSAVRYLQREPEVIAATGGTNWQKYLPPRFRRVMFFPELWTVEEKLEWGKPWVVKEVFNQ